MILYRAIKHFWVNSTQMIFTGQVFIVETMADLPTPASDTINGKPWTYQELYEEITTKLKKEPR